jgi:hemerythrin-like domain-containing protein
VNASDTAIATIRAEHHSLGQVLHTVQVLLSKVAAGHAPVDFGLLSAALYYIDDFPERCHHPKEDEYLFKRLRLRTTEFDAVLDRLQAEHARGAVAVSALHRALVLYQGGAPDGLRLLETAINGYAAGTREHFAAEECLLVRAQSVLTEADWALIAWAFESNDDPLFGSNRRLEFSQLHHRILLLAPRKLKRALRGF